MRNQPKYHFLKNSLYAFEGLKEVLKNETSFKIEIILLCILLPCIILLPIPLIEKLLLFMSYSLIPLVEILNSAIERCVDLITTKHHPLAKNAKDAGSAAVLFSVFICCIVWISVLINIIFD